ncbi:MAG: hypothetical protein ACE5J1_02275 [Nitrospiria bacterium]
MENGLAIKLDPKKTSDAVRKSTMERLVYSPAAPDPDLWRLLLPYIQKEPVEWIRQLEIRLLKRIPFSSELGDAIISLFSLPKTDIHLEGAILLRNNIVRLVTEKKDEERKAFEAKLLEPLLSQLKREELIAEHAVWMELYKTLANFSQSDRTTRAMIEMAPKGGDKALYIFTQYIQGKYPKEALEPLLAGFPDAESDETAIHLLRALRMALPKEGPAVGYPSTEPVIRTLLDGLKNKSENIRKEAAISLTSRAKASKILKSPLPLEDEIWEALFSLYQQRLSSTTALDKDQAREGLRFLPAEGGRLTRLFELMHSVEDELQKQNVVGLIGTFKTEETRAELIKMLKVNFAGLRLEAQKTTIDTIASFIPDEEAEAEMEKLLEGKGLHADVQAKLGDKLFSKIPSLKERLHRWLGLNEKTKRPMMERFDLPMMHIKIIESAKRLSGDPDIGRLLRTLEPLLMMNDAKVKLHETLRLFPESDSPSKPEPQIVPFDQVAKTLLSRIGPLAKARIVFAGFNLPEEFGGSKELEYGNVEQTNAQGLGTGAAEMGKDFVKTMIESIFSGEPGTFVPPGTKFRLAQEEQGVFTLTALSPESTPAKG